MLRARPTACFLICLTAPGCFYDPMGATGDATTSSTDPGTEPTASSSSSSAQADPTTTGEPPTGCADPYISRDEIFETISADLDASTQKELTFTRYFSLVHLHNAGWCDPEIEVVRQAIIKLVNSLSRKPVIAAPQPIDDARLLLRIDLRDYGWGADEGEKLRLSEPTVYFPGDSLDETYTDRWEMIADQNPYSIEFVEDAALALKTRTATHFPVVAGDAFLDVAARAPLYYDILGIPKRSGQLTTQDPPCAGECLTDLLGFNIATYILKEWEGDGGLVNRAGLRVSGISNYNRVVERHTLPGSPDLALWIAYDFTSQAGTTDIGAHPLDFTSTYNALHVALPNGLLAYMLTDGAGNRINVGPLSVLQDDSQPDALVRAGVSCIGCHSAGVITRQDDIRHELDNGMSTQPFDDNQIKLIRAIYPQRADMDLLYAQDAKLFNNALLTAGVAPTSNTEPVLATFLRFDEPVDLPRAAAELDLRPDELTTKLDLLPPELEDLTENTTVPRDTFTDNFAASACALRLGCTRACPAVPDPEGEPGNPYAVVCSPP